MRIFVTKDKVTINEEEKKKLHDGESNVNKCEFDFSREYDDPELALKAVFDFQDKVIEKLIYNNECDIPQEVLNGLNCVHLGVYASKIVDDEKVIRYSPEPDRFEVGRGSYTLNALEEEKIEPSLIEQYQNALQKGLAKVENSLKEINETNDDIKQKLEDGEFNGQDGKSAYQIWLDEGNTGTEQDFLNSLKGTDGIQGPPGQNGQDGHTPIYGQDYMGPDDKKAIQDYCKNYIDENYLNYLQGEC